MEANKETVTISVMRERLLEKAAEDEAFRARLLADPKDAIRDALGMEIPDELTISVHEEEPGTSHLVLPPSPALAEADLEQAAGAFDWNDLRGL